MKDTGAGERRAALHSRRSEKSLGRGAHPVEIELVSPTNSGEHETRPDLKLRRDVGETLHHPVRDLVKIDLGRRGLAVVMVSRCGCNLGIVMARQRAVPAACANHIGEGKNGEQGTEP